MTKHALAALLAAILSACSGAAPSPFCAPPCVPGQICQLGGCGPVDDAGLATATLPDSGAGLGPDSGTAGPVDSGAECQPSCNGACKGASDGCGGTCPVGDCAGCCDGDGTCQTGQTAAACGIDGNACVSCGTAGECLAGECCSPSPTPACSLVATSNGCGTVAPASCAGEADGGARVCCGGADGTCCDAKLCCGSTCCGAGQECAAGGQCCSPSCAGKCPGADDGCGQQCPLSAAFLDAGCVVPLSDGGHAAGCCDSSGACQQGLLDTACGPAAFCQDCAATGETCGTAGPGPGFCCTPGGGCGGNCGEENFDDCGVLCPNLFTCDGCCDADRNCNPGNSSSACGIGDLCGVCTGAEVCNVTGSGATASASCGTCANGATQTVDCNGHCGLQQQSCQGGQWQNVGSCTNDCTGGCCAQQLGVCGGTGATACGGDNGACTDCTLWAQGLGATASYGSCQHQTCCLAIGAMVSESNYTSATCCSGHAQLVCHDSGSFEVCVEVCD